MKVIALLSLISMLTYGVTHESNILKENEILNSIPKHKAFAILTVAEMNKCEPINISEIDNQFIQKLNDSNQDIILAVEEIFKINSKDIKKIASGLIKERCQVASPEVATKATEEIVEPINEIQLYSDVELTLETNITPNITAGIYPMLFTGSNNCKILAKTKVDNNAKKIMSLSMYCKNNKAINIHGLIVNTKNSVDNFNYQTIGKKYKLIILKTGE